RTDADLRRDAQGIGKRAWPAEQLRFKVRRRYRDPDLRRTYGLLISACPRCRHVMYFDEDTGDPITCDRCKKIYG
ncbi:MAG: hypothetical protein K0Q64_2240, partial [Nitrobacter vulgaris]|nr:hypothetical protein [Nitrobacter vulgaris]